MFGKMDIPSRQRLFFNVVLLSRIKESLAVSEGSGKKDTEAQITFIYLAERLLRPSAETLFSFASQRPGFKIEISCKDFESDLMECSPFHFEETFDRIYLGNVTDYTSYISVFTTCSSAFRSPPTSTIMCAIFVCCDFYNNAYELLASTICIPSPDILRRLFGMEIALADVSGVFHFKPVL